MAAKVVYVLGVLAESKPIGLIRHSSEFRKDGIALKIIALKMMVKLIKLKLMQIFLCACNRTCRIIN